MNLNDYVILTNVASQIKDYQTLMNFMLVNKKCLRAVKHFINQIPAVYVALIKYETQPIMRLDKFVFNSLKELFIELHQKHLKNPIKNFSGPCVECLSKTDFEGCYCDDINYKGIKIIKYFHTPPPEIVIYLGWKPVIIPLHETNGFRMSRILKTPYFQTETSNRKSMLYLYNGITKADELLKLGLKAFWNDGNIFYPVTTDNLEERENYAFFGERTMHRRQDI